MTTRSIALVLLAGGAALVALGTAGAQEGAPVAAAAPHLVTLHRNDPIAHTINLRTGAFGASIDGDFLVERRAHLDYGVYHHDALTVGLDEDDRGVILDLGHWTELAQRHDFEEVDGGGVGFASLRLSGSEIEIAREVPRNSFQRLREARSLVSTNTRGTFRATLPVVEGHVYLVRVESIDDDLEPVFAKLLVVEHAPGKHVVLRWQRLTAR